ADLIVLGPGSLYTSVLPNLMVAGVAQAIRWSAGKVVYVCNVATQPGETDHFGAADHIRAIVDHIGDGVLDYALVNSNAGPASNIRPEWRVDPVGFDSLRGIGRKVRVIARDVVNDHNPLRHDPDKLAQALLEIGRMETGPEEAVEVTWEPSQEHEVEAVVAANGLVPTGGTRE
ncbi:MAG: 2-phospho-L-lactate transferase CofD family protein, partial [Chloroflexota bacterium]|nr:2-phospho-L-lactate transferase CofD family protein [Chloroflexota bacterium]